MPIVQFDWDEIEDNIDEEFDEHGNSIVEYSTEPGYHGNVISQFRDCVTSTFHHDGLGSTIAVTNDAGDVTDTLAYSAFGGVTHRTGTTEFPFQFVGQKGYYFDMDTGDYYVRQRPYRPKVARWLSKDPIRSYPLYNSFDYCANRPLAFIDPSGSDFIALAHFHIPQTPFYHYSLEYWNCEQVELRQIELNNNPYHCCFATDWVELGGYDWVATATAVTVARRVFIGFKGFKAQYEEIAAGKKEDLLVPISVINYNRPDHGSSEAILPLFQNPSSAVVRVKWDLILDNARKYKWAEQDGFAGKYTNWPRSLYFRKRSPNSILASAGNLMAGTFFQPGEFSRCEVQVRNARPIGGG